jgi:hypothetical protein
VARRPAAKRITAGKVLAGSRPSSRNCAYEHPESSTERTGHRSKAAEFKTWAIVEVVGHVECAGFVTSETIAGSAMLRIDVPEVKERAATKKEKNTPSLQKGRLPVRPDTL